MDFGQVSLHAVCLGSGPIDVMRSICFRLCKKTGYERPLWLKDKQMAAAAAALPKVPRQASG